MSRILVEMIEGLREGKNIANNVIIFIGFDQEFCAFNILSQLCILIKLACLHLSHVNVFYIGMQWSTTMGQGHYHVY